MKIVGIGASTTAGTPGFYSPRERPPEGEGNIESQYAYWMMKKRADWTVLNRGMRGQRTDQILMRFHFDVIERRCDLVIILGGTNDLYQGYGVDHAMKNLNQMYDQAALEKIKIVTATIPPLDLATPDLKEEILYLNEAIKSNAERRKLPCCDVYSLLENPSNKGFMLYSPDQIHPDIEGYRLIGEAFVKVIQNSFSL
jgi:lysophospholipase L1-like esterase